jgi:hypothetical protein
MFSIPLPEPILLIFSGKYHSLHPKMDVEDFAQT